MVHFLAHFVRSDAKVILKPIARGLFSRISKAPFALLIFWRVYGLTAGGGSPWLPLSTIAAILISTKNWVMVAAGMKRLDELLRAAGCHIRGGGDKPNLAEKCVYSLFDTKIAFCGTLQIFSSF